MRGEVGGEAAGEALLLAPDGDHGGGFGGASVGFEIGAEGAEFGAGLIGQRVPGGFAEQQALARGAFGGEDGVIVQEQVDIAEALAGAVHVDAVEGGEVMGRDEGVVAVKEPAAER